MELIFLKAGKYKSSNKVVVVTEENVKNKTLIYIDGNNAQPYLDYRYAILPVKEIKQQPVKKLTQKVVAKAKPKVDK